MRAFWIKSFFNTHFINSTFIHTLNTFCNYRSIHSHTMNTNIICNHSFTSSSLTTCYLFNEFFNRTSLIISNYFSILGKGKKGKKGKKGLMKLFFLGTIIKSKIELLLKVLSFKLQIKFLVIAAVNLVINLARFWIDLKNKPQKVRS